jgi:hypothetical protein
MPRCKKRRCNAHSLRTDPYCLFHQRDEGKKKPASERPVRPRRTKDQDSIIRTGIANLFETEEGRELLRSEIKKQLVQSGLVIPIGYSLSIISWNYPGYFHQHIYDKVARGMWWAWIVWYERFGIKGSPINMPDKKIFMARVDAYIASRYVKTGRVKRAMIGGTARLASKALFVLFVLDTIGTASRVSDQAFGKSLLLYERNSYVKPGVRDIGKASYLETLVRAGEYRV